MERTEDDEQFMTMSVAEQLHAYMQFRAAHEKVDDKLTPAFFAPHIATGMATFFGVTVDRKGIVSDAQQPLLLARYRKEMADEQRADEPTAAALHMLRTLSREGHLVATGDVDGAPYHHVTKVSQHSEQPGTFILWLDPQGDHDLTTPMTSIIHEDVEADDE